VVEKILFSPSGHHISLYLFGYYLQLRPVFAISMQLRPDSLREILAVAAVWMQQHCDSWGPVQANT